MDARSRESTPVCIDDEIPFEIPESWEWARLVSVADVQLGKMLDKQKNQGSPKPYLANINVQWGRFDLDDVKTMLFRDEELDKFRLQPGDLMVCEGGVPGRSAIWETDEEMYYQKAIHRIRCVDELLNVHYCNLVLDLVVNSHTLDGEFTGTTIKHLPARVLEQWKIPLPPYAEQLRIVSRVKELIPLVNNYGALEEARNRLDAELPGRLRKSVLQLAVQGKLVPQDPADEPGSALLDRIRAERAALVKAKKVRAPRGGESVIWRSSDGGHYEKRGDGEPVRIDDEIPFEIPESWAWARLESVTTYIQRGKSPKYSPIKKYPVVAQKCNQWSGFSLELAKFIDPTTVSSYAEERILEDGDLLWNSTGLGTLGRMAIYDSSVNEYGWAVADRHVTVIRTLPDWLDYSYAFAYFAGPSVQSAIEDQSSGSTKQKELAQYTVRNYLIPVPPRCEQTRIAKELEKVLPRLFNR